MKKVNYFFSIMALVAFTMACSTSNQAKSDTEIAINQQVSKKIQAKDFTIQVNFANPMGGKGIYLTSTYDLTIRNDSALAYLPYYGRAYSAPYGGGEGGIKFQTIMKDYKVASNEKKGEWNIKFKADTPDYNYDVSIDIYSNGKSTLNFNSNQRQPISFNGEMKLDDKN